MKGYKVGQTFYWSGVGDIVVLKSSKNTIDFILDRADEGSVYSRGALRVGSYPEHTPLVPRVAPNRADDIIYGGKRVVDRYDHYALISKSGRAALISAGCQRFKGVASARKHWKNRKRGMWAYAKHAKKDWAAITARKKDKDRNTWSLAFVRQVERAIAKRNKK